MLFPSLLLLLLACGDPDADPSGLARGRTPDESTTTLIIGGGVAGLAVASELEEGLLLEGASELGGRALWAGGLMYFVDFPEQTEEDSVEQALEDWEALTGEPPTEATERWMEQLPTIYERVTGELGLAIQSVSADPVLQRQRVATPSGGGPGLVNALEEALPAGVAVRTDTWVSELWIEGGRARGVELADGTLIGAEAVVIASGGFAGDVERLATLDALTDLPYGAWGEASDGGGTGGALDWADEHGLAADHLEDVGWFHNSIAVPGDDGRPLKLASGAEVPWIFVNQEGARFVDESSTGSVLLSTPWRAQEQVWGITSAAALDEDAAPDDQDELEAARASEERIHCAADVEALAELIGLDTAGLEATLAEVSALRAGSGDDALGRRGSSFIDYASGDLCAFDPGVQAQKSFGGLVVDAAGAVLDEEGEVVPGLYAVGEAAGMGSPGMGGRSGFDGSLTAVLWSGWTVGAALAALD